MLSNHRIGQKQEQPPALSAKRKLFLRRSQSTIEYSILIAIVAAAVIAMQLYVRRAVKANLKVLEEQINAEPVDR